MGDNASGAPRHARMHKQPVAASRRTHVVQCLRRKLSTNSPEAHPDLSAPLQLGLHTLNALEQLHDRGCVRCVPASHGPSLITEPDHCACSYIHRDVKPANFTVGHGAHRLLRTALPHRASLTAAAGALDAESTFFIIDFGLARKYVDERGAVNPQVRTRTCERR